MSATTHRNGETTESLRLALAAIDAASDYLARYALTIDWPELGAVEAADLLDAARDALGAPIR